MVTPSLSPPEFEAVFRLAGYGLLMEWLQGLSGQRSYDLLDAVANTAGVAVGLLAGIARPLRSVNASTLPTSCGMAADGSSGTPRRVVE